MYADAHETFFYTVANVSSYSTLFYTRQMYPTSYNIHRVKRFQLLKRHTFEMEQMYLTQDLQYIYIGENVSSYSPEIPINCGKYIKLLSRQTFPLGQIYPAIHLKILKTGANIFSYTRHTFHQGKCI